jgi:hypothetical protein
VFSELRLKGKIILAFFLPKFFGMKAGEWLIEMPEVLLQIKI